MAELLLEVGCEELPATFVRKATTDLRQQVLVRLKDSNLLETGWAATELSTPRRLIVQVTGLKTRLEDREEEVRGPGVKAAFDAAGNPTGALIGFCKKFGVDAASVQKGEQYVSITHRVPGGDASHILAAVLPEAIRALAFEKSMRWGASRMRFARPIRWILATLDGATIPFEIEGVDAGNESHGHRFYDPGAFAASGLTELVDGLRKRKVEPDASIRRALVVDGAKGVADGVPDLPEALVDENVYLTEWPVAIAGHFRDSFKDLPAPVLVTAMAKHEKMFPVRDAEGRLTNQFVFIRNSGEDDTVRAGAEWVLNARFNDAKFFFEQDCRHDLDYFLSKTSTIVFQEKLGSVRERADRLAELATLVARATGADKGEIEFARQAGLYCKADLSTGLVSELASLQGVVGSEYARREGLLPDPVCMALGNHYDLGKTPDIGCAGARTTVRTLIADQLDKLVGYLGLGLKPSGTRDPYGLRRSATLLIEAAWRWPGPFAGYTDLIGEAAAQYEIDMPERAGIAPAVAEIFRSRYEALMGSERKDVLEAATLPNRLDPGADRATLDPRLVRLRVEALQMLRADEAFVQTATRPLNIAGAAQHKGVAFGGLETIHSLTSPTAQALAQVTSEAHTKVLSAIEAEDAGVLVTALMTLQSPINHFFEATMIMAEDPQVRAANLALVRRVSEVLLQAGDISRLVFDGA